MRGPKLDVTSLNSVGRSYYIFCIESALVSVKQARALVKGDPVDGSHQLALIERLLDEALAAA